MVWATGIGALVSLPFDNLKTRLQKAFPDSTLNRLNYGTNNNLIQTFFVVANYEKGFALWAGFYAYYARVFGYGFMTVWLMDKYTTAQKRKARLPEEYM